MMPHHQAIIRRWLDYLRLYSSLWALALFPNPYLPKVLPGLLHAVRTWEDGLKEFTIWKLETLVSIVCQHICKYLPELLSLIPEQWIGSFSLPAPKAIADPYLHAQLVSTSLYYLELGLQLPYLFVVVCGLHLFPLPIHDPEKAAEFKGFTTFIYFSVSNVAQY